MDELLTVSQVAKVLKINNSTVYELIHQHKLKALKLGAWKVRAVTLQQFLIDLEAEQNPEKDEDENKK